MGEKAPRTASAGWQKGKVSWRQMLAFSLFTSRFSHAYCLCFGTVRRKNKVRHIFRVISLLVVLLSLSVVYFLGGGGCGLNFIFLSGCGLGESGRRGTKTSSFCSTVGRLVSGDGALARGRLGGLGVRDGLLGCNGGLGGSIFLLTSFRFLLFD